MTLFGFGFWRRRGDFTSSGPRIIAGRLAPQPRAGTSYATACSRTISEVDQSITVDIPGVLEPDQFPLHGADLPQFAPATPRLGGQESHTCPPVPQNVIGYNIRARGYVAMRRRMRAAK